MDWVGSGEEVMAIEICRSCALDNRGQAASTGTGVFRLSPRLDGASVALKMSGSYRCTVMHTAEYLEAIVRNVADGVVMTDADGRVIFLNPEAERLSEWTIGEARGEMLKSVFKLIFERGRKPCGDLVRKVVGSGLTLGVSSHVLLMGRKGGERRVNYRITPVKDEDGGVIGTALVFSDISGQVELERELQKLQRLQSLALVTGGIAHDFNNILTGILGNLSLARECCNPRDKVFTILRAAERASLRAKDLTQQLLSYSKDATPVLGRVDMAAMAREAGGFILSGSSCRLEAKIEPDLRLVEADEGQISQVLNNLLLNASQSMGTGGVVRLVMENVEVAADSGLPLKPGLFIKVSVSDHGEGIRPENLERIFEPYFTTKESGSGLGLAMCRSIIKVHGGHIAVESKQGSGTRFTFYLPALQATCRATREQVETAQVVKGKGSVLVMDDEEMVRQIASDMLSYIGYTVTLCEDGKTAVDTFRRAVDSGQPFDFAVLDLTIPGSGGAVAVLSELRAIDPAAKVLVSSGYAEDPAIVRPRDFGFDGSVRKPYTIEQLGRAFSDMDEK